MRNPTFPGQIHKTSTLPFLPGEAAAAMAAGLIASAFLSPLLSVAVSLVILLVLIGWRKLDAHRPDYARVFFEKILFPCGSLTLTETDEE